MSYVNRKSWKNKSSSFGYVGKNKIIRRIIPFFFLLFIVYELITSIFITSYKVESISMEPTIPSGSVILASPLIYGPELPFVSFRIPGLRKPVRGDLVISNPSYHKENPWYKEIVNTLFGFFTLQKKGTGKVNWVGSSMVKRVVAVPGDTIKMEDNVILIRPKSKNYFFTEKEIMQVEYEIEFFPRPELLTDDFPFSGNMRELTLGDDEYFLSGDNRSMSNDSYYWGPVTLDKIKAKVILEYAPEIKILQ